MTVDVPISAAKALRALIIETRKDTEAQRCLPDAVVKGLRQSRLCRLALPSEIGGLEADPVVALQVYEELASVEASVAWIVWNNSLPCFFGRFLSTAVRSEIFGQVDGMYASSTRATGRAAVKDDGYLVSGRWSLVSGCLHADWICVMCTVEKDGELQMIQPGMPETRFLFVPKGSYQIIDTWHVGGLRGTGSHDVAIDGVFVPMERTCAPTDRSRLARPIGQVPIACTMSAGHASICLGVARAALDAVLQLGRSKVSVDPVPTLRDRASNQFAVAEKATRIAAARMHLQAAIGALWSGVSAGQPWTVDEVGAVWSAAVSAAMECKTAVSTMYEIAGTSALYTDFILERGHRDIHAAMQHVIIQPVWLEQAGRVKLGLEPSNPLYAL